MSWTQVAESWCTYLQPVLLVESTGDHAALEQHPDAFGVALFDLKIQVGLPVLQLSLLQRLHVEVRALDLEKCTRNSVTSYQNARIIAKRIVCTLSLIETMTETISI